MSTDTVKGRITQFDSSTASGKVQVGKRRIDFDSTCFQSGRPTRFPRTGESVTVVYSTAGEVLLIRAEDAPPQSSR